MFHCCSLGLYWTRLLFEFDFSRIYGLVRLDLKYLRLDSEPGLGLDFAMQELNLQGLNIGLTRCGLCKTGLVTCPQKTFLTRAADLT